MIQTKRFAYIVALVGTFLLGMAMMPLVDLVSAHGGNTDLIHACVKNSNGSIRIVDANENCKNNETALDWTQNAGSNGGGYGSLTKINFDSTDDATLIPFNYHVFDGTTFDNVDFYTNPANINMSYGSFVNAQFTNINAFNVKARYADFTDASLTNIADMEGDFSHSNFSGATLSNMTGNTTPMLDFSDSTGIIFNNITNLAAGFEGASLINATFTDVSSQGFSFNSTNLSNATFNNFVFTGSIGHVINTNFTDADFIDSDLEGVYMDDPANTFTGTTWSNTICPDGTNSDNNGNTCLGHLTPIEI